MKKETDWKTLMLTVTFLKKNPEHHIEFKCAIQATFYKKSDINGKPGAKLQRQRLLKYFRLYCFSCETSTGKKKIIDSAVHKGKLQISPLDYGSTKQITTIQSAKNLLSKYCTFQISTPCH